MQEYNWKVDREQISKKPFTFLRSIIININ